MKKSIPRNKIICCDVLEGLRELPDQSVQCVITSPPYFGLRDYKTAKWQGGDENCDHVEKYNLGANTRGGLAKAAEKADGRRRNPENRRDKTATTLFARQYRNICGKCEAKKTDKQIGSEETLQEYIQNLVNVFQEVWRVLRDDGTVWLNLGDSYNAGRNGGYAGGGKQGAKECYIQRSGMNIPGLKPKDLCGVPWRVAFALQEAGWYLRNEIIWAKSISFCKTYVGSCMPDSCRDRSTRSHEQIFLLTKKPKYFYDQEAIKEEGVWPAGTKAAKGSGTREGNRRGEGYATYNGKRNTRSVWAIPVKPYKEAHFATFPEGLVEPCIKAGTSEKGCCSKCGTPYKRIIKKAVNPSKFINDTDEDISGGAFIGKTNNPQTSKGLHRNKGGVYSSTEFLGWESTCNCNPKIAPCVVLDIFGGSGTVGAVAKKLGRDYILFDLNPEYCELAEKRINK